MKFNNLQIMSTTTLNFDITITSPICVFCGRYSDLALDLIREVIGDCGAQNDPDSVDDGRFAIHAEIEIDDKNYSVCYIRNADFMGDDRLAVNFEPNGVQYSEDDTREFVDKCSEDDRRPFFICDYFDRLDEATDITPVLDKLSSLGRQVFISVCSNYPIQKMQHDKVQVINTGINMKESICAALRGEYGKRALPPIGTAYDEDHTVIVCPVCKQKTLDNHDICRHCGWEYDGFPEDHYSAANGTTLAEYREQYKQALKERKR